MPLMELLCEVTVVFLSRVCREHRKGTISAPLSPPPPKKRWAVQYPKGSIFVKTQTGHFTRPLWFFQILVSFPVIS